MPRCTAGAPPRPFPMSTTIAAAALLLGACAALPARATPARVFALGGGDYLEDTSALFRWPGSARDDAGWWSVDAGRIDPEDGWTAPGAWPRTGPAAAFAWTPGGQDSPWVAAFAVHARAADSDHVGLHRDGPGASFTWLAGRRLGPLDVAATWRSAYGGLSSDADARDEFEHHRDDFGLGARFDLSPGAYVDVAGDMRRERNRALAQGDPGAWDTGNLASNRSWSVRARAFIAVRERLVLAPVAEILREDYAGPVENETWRQDTASTHNGRLHRLGLGLCWLPDPDRLVALTIERLDIDNRHALIVGNELGLPRHDDVTTGSLRLAAEQRLNWWLSLRASLAWTRATYADIRGGAGQVDAAGGAALHLGVWGLDVAAGSEPLPEPWRWLSLDPKPGLVLRATLHRDF